MNTARGIDVNISDYLQHRGILIAAGHGLSQTDIAEQFDVTRDCVDYHLRWHMTHPASLKPSVVVCAQADTVGLSL